MSAGAAAATGSGRSYGRAADGLRPATIQAGFVATATGSALISAGETRVICTASVEDRVPRWLAGSGRGWVTAEYGMLPASTTQRKPRDGARGRPDGRSIEIQRLIGRSLRGVVDFSALGERTVTIDCDVLTADGGTRCASITGGMVALELALGRLVAEGRIPQVPLTGTVAAVSAGIVGGTALLDLDYSEDSTAEVDANVVMTGDGGLVEVQATAERTPLSRAHLDALLELASAGIAELRELQRETVSGAAAAGSTAGAGAAALGTIVLSTRNPHKVREFDRLLGATGLRIEPLPESVTLPPEDGATFADNALGKARAAAAATDRVAVADDSGIESAALDGRPGVRSARFAGERATDAENLAKLLDQAPAGSRLRYVCAVAFVDPISGREHVVHGECTGTVAATPAGTGGFGYDPAFLPDGDHDGRTMAQLTDAEKDAISHRGVAVRALAQWLGTL